MKLFLIRQYLILFLLSLFSISEISGQKSELHFLLHNKQQPFPEETRFQWLKLSENNFPGLSNNWTRFNSSPPSKLSNMDSVLFVQIQSQYFVQNNITHLIIPNCHINFIHAYYINELNEIVDSAKVVGDRIAFSNREERFPEYIIPLEIKKPYSALIVSLDKSNEPFYTSIQGVNPAELEARKTKFYLLSGTILGILAAAFLLNLYILLNTKTIINYLYSFFLALCIVYTLSDFGYLHWMINYNSNWIIDIIRPLSLSIAFPIYLFFFLNTLSINESNPIASRRIKIYGWIWLTYVIVATSISPFLYDNAYKYYSLSISMLFQQVTLIIIIWGSVKSFLAKDKFAIPFLITCVLFVVTHIQHLLHQFGFIEDTVINQHFLPIVLALDCLFIGGIVALKFIDYIHHNRILQLELKNKDAEINERIAEIQLRELSRISQLLHNHIGVELMSLHSVISSSKKEMQEGTYEVIHQKTTVLIDDVRNAAHFLSPQILKKFGLSHCIQLFVHEVAKIKEIKCYIEISPECNQLPLSSQLIVMLVIQECVNNTIKHANASEIQIQVFIENEYLFMSYSDDGIGVNLDSLNSSGLGLVQMEEMISLSKGQIKYFSSPGKGFQVESNIPLIK
jgi:signal transduction histidine kinase